MADNQDESTLGAFQLAVEALGDNPKQAHRGDLQSFLEKFEIDPKREHLLDFLQAELTLRVGAGEQPTLSDYHDLISVTGRNALQEAIDEALLDLRRNIPNIP